MHYAPQIHAVDANGNAVLGDLLYIHINAMTCEIISAHILTRFSGNSVLWVNSRWNFSIMGYETSTLRGTNSRNSLKQGWTNFRLMRKPTVPVVFA
jgi:hypothetical protein